MEVEESPAIRKMRARLERRSMGGGRTADVYAQRLGQFFGWLGQTPEEFIEGMEAGETNVTETVNDFLDTLHERKLAPATMAGHVNAVKKLVEVNSEIAVNWKKVEKPKITRVEEDQIPTKPVIRRVLLHASTKERAIALVAASSGLRGDTIVRLSMGDLDLESEADIGVIRVPASKSKGQVKFTTFITPEARESLEACLSSRGSLSPEDPVFATKHGKFYTEADKLTKRWVAPLEKAGLGQRTGKWRDYRFHTLRKFFRTALEYAGVSRSYRERMLGHAGDYLDGAYFGPSLEKLKGEYRLAIPHLTIEEAGVSEERVQTLEEELAETRRAFETLKDATVGRMMRQLEAAGVDTSKSPHEIAAEMGIVGEAETEQKVIEEEELVLHLSNQWRFVSALNGTKVVVERGVG